MISTPVSSPCAPAAGCKETAAKPLDLGQADLQLEQQLHRALGHLRVLQGCRLVKPGSAAAFSLTLGLYFMVHDPNG